MHFNIKNILLLFFVLFLGIGIFLLLNVCADLHRISNKALVSMRKRNWARRKASLEMTSFLRSCKPISMGYGTAYVIRKKSALNFLKFVTRGTVRALLAGK